MFDKLRSSFFVKHLSKAELDEYGVLRSQNGKNLIAFIYIFDGKEFIYVFNSYKSYRTQIEKVIAEKRNNATRVQICDWADMGYDFRPDEDAIHTVRTTPGGIFEDGNDEQL